MSDSLSDRIGLAYDHVIKGRAIVAKQRRLIASIRDRKGDSVEAESLLIEFEKTLVIFEEDLEELIARVQE